MLARQVRGVAVAGVDERAQTGKGADDVVAGQRHGQSPVDHVEEEDDVRLRDLGDVGDRARGGLVGQPDVRAAELSRQHEAETIDAARHRDGQRTRRVPQRRRVDDQVRAARGAHRNAVGQLPGPHARGIDHRSGAHVDGAAGDVVAERGSRARRPGGADLGQNLRAVAGGGAGQRDDQAGIVDELPVVVDEAELQPLAAHRRGQFGHAAGADRPRPRQRLRRRSRRGAQQVAEEEPDAGDQALRRDRIVDRHHLRQRPDQVRGGDLHERAAFAGRPHGNADVARCQVAQPAVGQLRRPPRRAERQVVGVDERDVQSARRRVQRDAGAGDAAADDQQVGPVAGLELRPFAGAAFGVEGGVAHRGSFGVSRAVGSGRSWRGGAVGSGCRVGAPPRRRHGIARTYGRLHNLLNCYGRGLELVA